MTYPVVHRDYETRSECDLKKAGAHAYAAHPSTRIICGIWIIEYERDKFSPTFIWQGALANGQDYLASPKMPFEPWRLIKQGCTVAGHNAAFEAAIDEFHAGPVLGWPIPKLENLDCTMARAAVQALPLDLDRLSHALGLSVKKDQEGHRLMLRMCKPRKPHKGEDYWGIYWDYTPERLARLIEYCETDVWTEIGADHALRPLQDQERPVWLLDQIMNNRGVQIDRDFVDLAEAAVRRALARADARMCAVTHGLVEKVTQLTKLKAFAELEGVQFPTIEKRRINGEKYEAERADKEALTDLLIAVQEPDEINWDEDNPSDLLPLVPGLPNAEWDYGDPPSIRAAFEVRLEAGKSSLKKLAKCRSQAPEGRARGNLQYHAASPGRWGGRGIQLQNMMRKGVTEPGGWEQAYADLREMDDQTFEMVWGSPLDVISRMMRGAVIAAPGHQLYYADYSNVEARGCVWTAGQTDMVELFALGRPIYEEMAAYIFGLSVDEVMRLHKTKQDIIPRFVGKETVLGCGYGMGWRAFIRNCKKKGGIILPDEIAQKGVGAWRERNSKVVRFWRDLEDAAKNAIRIPERVFSAGPFCYRVKGHWLQCRLPSGRLIWYRRPKLKPAKEDLEACDKGEEVPEWFWKIHYLGVNGITKQWDEETTWGGKLLENCIQGMCADFLRSALLDLEAAHYWPVLSIHDEPISEVPLGFGSVDEFVGIVSRVPTWAPGFPLKAEGGCGTRYIKA